MKRVRSSKRILLVLAVVAAVIAVPALAHQSQVFHGNDYAQMGQDHNRVWACDHEADGNGVRAQTRNVLGNIDAWAWDPDGAGGVCSESNIPNEEIEYRVCENNVGCSGWRFE